MHRFGEVCRMCQCNTPEVSRSDIVREIGQVQLRGLDTLTRGFGVIEGVCVMVTVLVRVTGLPFTVVVTVVADPPGTSTQTEGPPWVPPVALEVTIAIAVAMAGRIIDRNDSGKSD